MARHGVRICQIGDMSSAWRLSAEMFWKNAYTITLNCKILYHCYKLTVIADDVLNMRTVLSISNKINNSYL